jgi:transcriptional regulator with XRE-family HTH domain
MFDSDGRCSVKQEVGARLEEALAKRDRTITSLQEAMEDRGLSGVSYPNVHAYVKGKTMPSIEFLAAAAEDLDVSFEYLALGRGSIDEPEAIVERANERIERHEQEILDALRESFRPLRKHVAGTALTAAYKTWSHVLAVNAAKHGNSGDFVENARRVGEAMQAPLDALGINDGDLSLWGLDVYTTLLAQALQVVTVSCSFIRPQPAVFLSEAEATDVEA